MHYGEIKKCDIANGPGVRVSLFVSGCRNHCPGCFNKETWDFCYGKPFTTETKDHIMELLKPDYIEGFSLLGGEPFEPENQEELVRLLKEIKENYPKKNIWCYTGYTYDKDLLEGGKVYTPFTEEMLSYIDTLVDGQFIESQKDITLKFRGSANQRILDLNEKQTKEMQFFTLHLFLYHLEEKLLTDCALYYSLCITKYHRYQLPIIETN